MGVKDDLEKISEIAKLVFYVETTPLWPFEGDERKRIIDKYRCTLTDNDYFTYFVEPLVLRLYDHATHSKHVKKYTCRHGGTTFAYTIRGHVIFPILTMGSPEQLYTVCKEECIVCPSAVYTPSLIAGLIQLSIFETSRALSKIKDRILL